MKEHYLYSIALFMICLIITLPIYVSNAYAAGLTNIKIRGGDGVEGYIKDGDTVVIEADSQISGDTSISVDQNRYGGSGICSQGMPFDSCVDPDKDGNFHCSISLDTTGWVLNHPRHKFDIFSFKDDCSLYDARSVYGYFDTVSPTVSLSVDKYVTNNEIKWNAHVRDWDDLQGSTCSGIDRVDFYLNDQNNMVDSVEGTNLCQDTLVVTHDATDFPNGDYVLYAKAYDRFDNPSQIAQTYFSIDTIPPDIFTSSMTIKDSTGREIEYLGKDQVLATVKVNVEATDDLDKSNIVADLSEFNPTKNYKDLPATCGNEKDGIIQCSWLIYIKISDSDVYHAKIYVPDDVGNINDADIPKYIEYDIDGPFVNYLETDRMDSSGMSYVRKSGNTFTASITDYGIGIQASDVFLDAKALGAGIIHATDCTEATCYWRGLNVAASDGVKKVSISSDTKDILGNKMSEPFTIDVTVDKTPPSFNGFSMRIGGSATEVYEGYIKTGDFLVATLNVTEAYPIFATADFSSIASGADSVEGTCIDLGNNKWQCSFETPTINIAGSAKLKFYVFDFAGNNLTYTKDIEVYGTTVGSVDYWSNTVSCSPKLIDRQLSKFVNQMAYCRVALTPKEDDPKTVAINLVSCSGNHLQRSELMNNQGGSIDPYIKLTLTKQELNLDKININCTLSIVSIAQGKVTTAPEQEKVVITLGLYNMPLGEYSQSVKDDIENARDTIDNWQLLGTLRKLVEYAKLICTFLSVLDNIRVVWDVISNGMDSIRITPPGEAAATSTCTISDVADRTEEKWYSAQNKFCKFLSCDLDFTGTEFWGMGQDGILSKWQQGGQNFFNNIDLGADYFGIDPAKYMNPKDSIAVSVLTGCIPGIIYGLDKYRQIECLFADCLESNAKTGMPIDVCYDQKAYAECTWVWGEIFALIPFTALFDYFMNMIKSALSNPLTLMGVALGLLCLGLCPESGHLHTVCTVSHLISVIGQLYSDLDNLDTTFEIKKDYCKEGGLYD
jgi:hypothetical protein